MVVVLNWRGGAEGQAADEVAISSMHALNEALVALLLERAADVHANASAKRAFGVCRQAIELACDHQSNPRLCAMITSVSQPRIGSLACPVAVTNTS